MWSGCKPHSKEYLIQYSRENLDCYGEGRDHHLEVWTRYSESIPYTGNSVDEWSTEEENRA